MRVAVEKKINLTGYNPLPRGRRPLFNPQWIAEDRCNCNEELDRAFLDILREHTPATPWMKRKMGPKPYQG